MIVLITGASHTGKTLLAQRTPEDDDALTEYLWPIVREMIKTAIENGQNLIVEGCYVPPTWRDDFDEEYLRSISFVCLAMTDDYIDAHFDEIMGHANDIETRLDDSGCSPDFLKADNRHYVDAFTQAGEKVLLIDSDFEKWQRALLDAFLSESDAR